ncbi:MAG: GlsB/YeaQ/YmgE family stress response membrane protein [Anaerolineae bacterium]|nr:GlsB/YeaQ/YmgE family stress response membrane protein [Anaerolineae bacterium]
MSTDQIIIWLIVGALAGSLVGMLITRDRKGFGLVRNLIVGLLGALIGGVIFDILDVDLGLGDLAITAEDLVAAFVGSLLLLVVVSFLGKK